MVSDETDYSLYLDELNCMTIDEIIHEYRELSRSRGEGGDYRYNLNICFDSIQALSEARNFELPTVPEDHVIFGYIKQVDTPESSSIEGYGYDYYTNTFYIKYKSNGKVYPFYDIPINIFNEFEVADSKGKYAAKIKKQFRTNL